VPSGGGVDAMVQSSQWPDRRADQCYLLDA
jgi:hypothetical protein